GLGLGAAPLGSGEQATIGEVVQFGELTPIKLASRVHSLATRGGSSPDQDESRGGGGKHAGADPEKDHSARCSGNRCGARGASGPGAHGSYGIGESRCSGGGGPAAHELGG